MQAVLVVMPIFIVIGIGWILKRKDMVSVLTQKENNSILYWLAIPTNLLRGILGADMSMLKDPVFLTATWLPYFVTLAAVWTIGRYRETPERFSSLALCSTRGNHFFAGVPIVRLAMGERGVEAAVIILACSLAVMQIASIGSGQLAQSGTLSWKSVKTTCLQLLKNPLFMACVTGPVLVLAGLNNLPDWLDETLGILADIGTGLALLMLGAELRLENFFGLLRSVWRIAAFKLAMMPIVTWIIFAACGVSEDMLQAGVLLAAMPVSVNTALVARAMGMDSEYCGRAVAVTTFCSLLSLPLWIRGLGLV